ncbi:hypothetical protein [Massilia sp. ST3]|uniref:hypothetical protein n=1 Tax=Massilia sp. ST3 TaxID=2824903 RepID=UPI001B824088|nr:hypothetical protein [Massilia sp. ST3]MBQ5946728.1 hypothetical protein [Massilia sp. ST3]
MKRALAACALAAASSGAWSQDAGIVFTLSNVHVSLRSMDGMELPLAVSGQRQTLSARAYSATGEHAERLDLDEEVAGAGVSVGHETAFVQVAVEGTLGGARGVATFAEPSVDWVSSEFAWGSYGSVTLPANSVLTIAAWATVRNDGAEENRISFEQALVAATEGAFGERYELRAADASSQYFISAINPLDTEATFHYYTELAGYAFSVSPVPEPSAWAMLAGGLLLLGWARPRPAGRGMPAPSH